MIKRVLLLLSFLFVALFAEPFSKMERLSLCWFKRATRRCGVVCVEWTLKCSIKHHISLEISSIVLLDVW